ncbi:Gfo/Idh/MocA family protein [Paenibacillus marinisediminis]
MTDNNRKVEPLRAGIIGCGNISDIYCHNLQRCAEVELAACADLDLERAQLKAAKHGIPRALTVEEMLSDEDIDIIINLTIPAAHAEVNIRALEAGKHVYVEKPFAVELEDGKRMLELAEAKNLLIGGAPDTFLGGGIQTCLKLIEDGVIGKPIAASGFMLCGGHESWHPAPEFYYKRGGGPMFDMGPYYLTALVALLGPIRRVTGSAQITSPQRTITSEPLSGQTIEVEVPTHIAGVLDFEEGAIATLVTSFDIPAGSDLPPIEIYGTHGTLRVPDPNSFGGPVYLKRLGAADWEEIPLVYGYADNSRGIGLIDMARAIRAGAPHRANGQLANHVLEAMHGFHIASSSGTHYEMKSRCERPALFGAAPDSVL